MSEEGEISPEGLQIYESYKDSFDALVNETRLLRAELIEGCRAFGVAMGKVEDDESRCEAFKLYLRDIHAAHEELTCRLSKLRDGAVRDEIAKRQEKIDTLNKQVEQLQKAEECVVSRDAMIASLKKEIDSLNDKLRKQVEHRKKIEDSVVEGIKGGTCEIKNNLQGLEMKLKANIGRARERNFVSRAIADLEPDELYDRIKKISELSQDIEKKVVKFLRGENEMP